MNTRYKVCLGILFGVLFKEVLPYKMSHLSWLHKQCYSNIPVLHGNGQTLGKQLSCVTHSSVRDNLQSVMLDNLNGQSLYCPQQNTFAGFVWDFFFKWKLYYTPWKPESWYEQRLHIAPIYVKVWEISDICNHGYCEKCEFLLRIC